MACALVGRRASSAYLARPCSGVSCLVLWPPPARELPEGGGGGGGGWCWASLPRADEGKAPQAQMSAARPGALSLDEGIGAQGIVGAEAPRTVQSHKRSLECTQLTPDLEGGSLVRSEGTQGAEGWARGIPDVIGRTRTTPNAVLQEDVAPGDVEPCEPGRWAGTSHWPCLQLVRTGVGGGNPLNSSDQMVAFLPQIVRTAADADSCPSLPESTGSLDGGGACPPVSQPRLPGVNGWRLPRGCSGLSQLSRRLLQEECLSVWLHTGLGFDWEP